jgi:hypothetical protein
MENISIQTKMPGQAAAVWRISTLKNIPEFFTQNFRGFSIKHFEDLVCSPTALPTF